ncbi:MAG: 3-keto-5-aminohexanoate cleavage protein, partial [Xanthomonadales bacterium]|nr:3-keto-5-aminohexanoate cleavage protein [Xanthomonadales bacterium]
WKPVPASLASSSAAYSMAAPEAGITHPLVVIAAPNGARLGKSNHPQVPLTIPETAHCAQDLAERGVSVLHLHVRDEAGRHSLDAGRYRETIAAIRARVGDRLVIQATTEAVGHYDRQQQMALARDLKPEAISLALRELCPDAASEPEAGEFFRELAGSGTWPQYILYSPQDCARFDRLRRDGIFGTKRPFALFVLGSYGEGRHGRPEELDGFLGAFEPGAFPWAVCCFGPAESVALTRAVAAGGHARIGFENNQQLPDGQAAGDNAELVEATLDVMAASLECEFQLASAQWVREEFMTQIG